MSSPLTYQEVCTKFAELALTQHVPLFEGDTVEQVESYLSEYGKDLVQGSDYKFTVDPLLYIREAYAKLAIAGFPWVNFVVERRKSGLELKTGKVNTMFLDAFNIYLLRCQVHDSLLEHDFSESVNYFIKTDKEGVSPLEGPFKKIPSSFFGGEQISFWDIEFPADSDMVVVYTNEGFLRMILRYKGKAVSHY